jgi:hypothetical protein
MSSEKTGLSFWKESVANDGRSGFVRRVKPSSHGRRLKGEKKFLDFLRIGLTLNT